MGQFDPFLLAAFPVAAGARTLNEGDMAQLRVFARHAADMALSDFVNQHPQNHKQPLKAEIPAPLKWAKRTIAALFIMGFGAMGVWLVTTVSKVQVSALLCFALQR